uniref:Uncharacterized protein n=1 Tax=Tanacetum cinerariifolium TaxID=118510 RepID=A0A6L2KHC6_TANCI|nr:hypothetical protein [Tanacetum cinerariifolium]
MYVLYASSNSELSRFRRLNCEGVLEDKDPEDKSLKNRRDSLKLISLSSYLEDTQRNIQLAVKGSHSSLDEETRKSQHLPKGTTTDPKDSRGNDQPADNGLPFTIFDEGTGKTKPLPEWPREDKDSERLKPLVDVESQTLLFFISHRLMLTLLLSDDELIKESNDDVFEAGDEMDEDIQQADKEETQDTDASNSESFSCSETFKPYDNYMPITERQLVRNLQHFSEVLYDQETMSNLDKISKAGVDERAKLLKSLNRLSKTLEADFALKKEMKKMAESNTIISRNVTNLTKMLRNAQLLEGMSSSTPSGGASIPTATHPEVHASVVIDITPHEQPESSLVASKANIRKRIATNDTESPQKLVKASIIVRPSLDEPVRVPYMIYRKIGTNRRNFDVHNPFKFADFRITKIDELSPIIEKKKNKIIALLAPPQTQSQSSGRKRKHMELEPKIKIPGLECNRSLPEGVPFVNNMVY